MTQGNMRVILLVCKDAWTGFASGMLCPTAGRFSCTQVENSRREIVDISAQSCHLLWRCIVWGCSSASSTGSIMLLTPLIALVCRRHCNFTVGSLSSREFLVSYLPCQVFLRVSNAVCCEDSASSLAWLVWWKHFGILESDKCSFCKICCLQLSWEGSWIWSIFTQIYLVPTHITIVLVSCWWFFKDRSSKSLVSRKITYLHEKLEFKPLLFSIFLSYVKVYRPEIKSLTFPTLCHSSSGFFPINTRKRRQEWCKFMSTLPQNISIYLRIFCSQRTGLI